MLRILGRITQLVESSCLVCRGAADGLLCRGCADDLPHLRASCHRCALPLSVAELHVCGACMNTPPLFVAAHAALQYDPPMPRLLQQWKYQQRIGLEHVLVSLMAHRVHRLPRPDVLVSVPLHRRRLRQRGFNQSALLAKGLGRVFGVPVRRIERVRHTPKQARLSAAQRQKNLRNAFATTKNFSGLHVVVVDDVMTTGATVTEVAKLLYQQGASRVDVWVAVRAIQPAKAPAES